MKWIARSAVVFALFATAMTAQAQIDVNTAYTKQAGLYEFNECKVPQALAFIREPVGSPNSPTLAMNRYVSFAGEGTYRMSTPNPEGVSTHGAGHYTNCTPGADPYNKYQYLLFKIRGLGYFSSVGNHVPVMTRAAFSGMQQPGSEAYQGIGVIFDRVKGVLAERFSLPGPSIVESSSMLHPEMPMVDGMTYSVLIHSAPHALAYEVTDERGVKVLANGGLFTNPLAHLYNAGVGFGVLCNEPNGACTNMGGSPFRLDIWDIQAGWFPAP